MIQAIKDAAWQAYEFKHLLQKKVDKNPCLPSEKIEDISQLSEYTLLYETLKAISDFLKDIQQMANEGRMADICLYIDRYYITVKVLFRPPIEEFILETPKIKKKMTEGFRRFFPEVKAYKKVGDEMVPMSDGQWRKSTDNKKEAGDTQALKATYFKDNIRRIKEIAMRDGDPAEIIKIIESG